MSEVQVNAPLEEQQICIGCGFCCDGTLFLHAMLNPGEHGNLPEKIEQNYRQEGTKEMFLLPCLYFAGRCTIYDSKKALVCSGYRCQLLNDFAAGRISMQDALDIVAAAKGLLEEIIRLYRDLTGKDHPLTFRELLAGLKSVTEDSNAEAEPDSREELLIGKCNIFEVLLIRHFRSAGDFERMMVSDNEKGPKNGDIHS